MEWISVEDRLPEPAVAVAGIQACTGALWACHRHSYAGATTFESEETGGYVPVTHWTPLPAPPEVT